MEGRDSFQLDPATSIQEQKYNRTLPVSNICTVFSYCLKKCHFSISFSKEMVGFLDFLFESRSFLGARNSKNIKKADIKIFGLAF